MSSPPKLAIKILNNLLSDEWKDEVLGDLEEEYRDVEKSRGKTIAVLIFWYETLKFFKPHLFNQKTQNLTIMMISNYFRIAYRNLKKNKIYSIVNVLGLAVGISSVLLISFYLMHQLSFDKFIPDSDRIYRIALERIYPDRVKMFGSSPITMAPVLEEHYEQVEAATRFHKLFFANEVAVIIDDDTYRESEYRFADENFFKVFDHEFVHGDPATALDEPNNVVITESIAQKYFKTTDALNKTFRLDTTQFVITGVIKDLPATTHMRFEVLGSIHQLPFLVNAIETNSWINPWVYTYVKLKENADINNFESQLPELVEKYGEGSIAERLGANFKDEGHAFNYFLQPLESIHLNSNLEVELAPNGEIRYIYMIAIIALILLVISSINFVNLSTARAAERAKEVGIRKVMGSLRQGLVYQFLAEAIFITIISACLALIIVWLVLPQFNNLLGIQLNLNNYFQWYYLGYLLLFILFIGVMAGLYPASIISSLEPAAVLKGKFKSSKNGQLIRNLLIGLQFFISITMISGAILVHQQLQFFRSKDLGFSKDQVGFMRVSQLFDTSWDALKNDLVSVNGIEKVAGNFAMPGEFLGSTVMSILDNPDISDIRVNNANFDDDYFQLMDFELVEGRSFDENINDSLSLMINESMANLLGEGSKLGMKIQSRGDGSITPNPVYEIIGVVRDYHFQSLHSEISPLAIFNAPNTDYTPPIIAFKYSDTNLSNLIPLIEEVWDKHTTQDFSVEFLDDNLIKLYQADLATGKLFDVFTIVAIVMSCIGLFGLATYTLNQRMKEMGVRKVLGASLIHIVFKFSQSLLLLICAAFVIAVPLTYYIVKFWLDGFAYSIQIGSEAFIFSAFITITLVVLTISYQTLKLAYLNPVTTLRDD